MTEERPVLVPLDGSKNAERAVPHALLFAALHRTTLRFVHVADEGQFRDANLTRASEIFLSYVEELMAREGTGECSHSAELLSGAPGASLIELAGEARMVALASHGQGGFHATFVGSVADKVVRGSPVPVLVVPSVGEPPAHGYERILVALDGSPEAEIGLAAAREIAAGTGAALTLVRAYMTVPYTAVGFVQETPSPYELMRTTTEDYLEDTAGTGEEWVSVQASPPVAIELTASRIGADLVVMTSCGKGLASRIALGSTTDRVMHSLHRTMLIVPVRR